MSIYENGDEKQFVRFDAAGTDKNNFFTANKMIDSSWTDVKAGPHNIFSTKW